MADNYIVTLDRIPSATTFENGEYYTYFFISGKLPLELKVGDLICINRLFYYVVEIDGETRIKCKEDK